ncbi:MAG TPA: hypothetical protein VGG85_07385 [Terracidiphilus sp.]|jgi:hypothetical protein
METQTRCAYNQSRECFLSLEVTTAEVPAKGLYELIRKLTLKPNEGLWLKSFTGIPAPDVPVPWDLIFLDKNCAVIEAVESFFTDHPSPPSPPLASVLVLPAHSIYSSQTQRGDQVVLCEAPEMELRLKRNTTPREEVGSVKAAVLLRQVPLWSGGPGLVMLEHRNGNTRPPKQETRRMPLIESGKEFFRQPRHWLARWWSPDPRKAPRNFIQGLAAYYWNGSSPQAQQVRDISRSGLYLVTEERWYPGTLILLTLQRLDGGESLAERAIPVQSRAVRWGSDGVGLEFILPDSGSVDGGSMMNGADKQRLEQFLKSLNNG